MVLGRLELGIDAVARPHRRDDLVAHPHAAGVGIPVVPQRLGDEQIARHALAGDHLFDGHAVLQRAGARDLDPIRVADHLDFRVPCPVPVRQRVDDALAKRIRRIVPTPRAAHGLVHFVRLLGDERPHRIGETFDEPFFDAFAAPRQHAPEIDERPFEHLVVQGVVGLRGPLEADPADPGMAQQTAGPVPEQHQTGDRARGRPVFPLDQESERAQPLVPCLVGRRRIPIADDGGEVIGQPLPAQIAQAAAGDRQQLGMNQSTGREQTRLLLAGRQPRRAADANVDVLPAVMPDDVRLGRPLGHRDDGDAAYVVDRDFLVERQDHGVDDPPEHGVHHPPFEMLAPNAGDGAVVFHPEQDAPALKVGEGHHFPGELLRAQVVALELHAGVFTAGDQLEEVRPFHRSGRDGEERRRRGGRAAPPSRERTFTPARRRRSSRGRPSAGSSAPGTGTSAACGRCRAGAASWRAGRGRGPGPARR